MTDALQMIEGLAPARALRASFIAYPMVNALHILAVGAVVTSVLVMHWALIVPRRSLPEDLITRQMRPVALIAFATAVLSGIALFSIRASDYAGNSAFLAKLGLIGAAIVNFLAFRMLSRSSSSDVLRIASAILSGLLWTAALVAGRFIGFLE